MRDWRDITGASVYHWSLLAIVLLAVAGAWALPVMIGAVLSGCAIKEVVEMDKTEMMEADIEFQRALATLAVRESMEEGKEGIQAGLDSVKSALEEALAKAMTGEEGSPVDPGAFIFARIDYDIHKVSGMFASSGSMKSLVLLSRLISTEISKRARAKGLCDCSKCLMEMEIELAEKYLAKSSGVYET